MGLWEDIYDTLMFYGAVGVKSMHVHANVRSVMQPGLSSHAFLMLHFVSFCRAIVSEITMQI